MSVKSERENPGLQVEITDLLREWSSGNDEALSEVLSALYDDLRSLARRAMKQNRNSTLQPTALVHEAYLRLRSRAGKLAFDNRYRFLHFMGHIMRNLLVDEARRKMTPMHGGDQQRVSFEEIMSQPGESGLEPEVLLSLDTALKRFSEIDPLLTELLELRFFAGLSVKEVAEYKAMSQTKVKTLLRQARLGLSHLLDQEKV